MKSDSTSWLARHVESVPEWFYWATPDGRELVARGSRRRHSALGTVPDESAWLTIAFDRSGEGWSGIPACEVVVPRDVVERERPPGSGRLPEVEIAISSNAYADRVRSALRAIDAGLVQKVVVARQHVVQRRLDLVRTIETLRDAYPTCFVFATKRTDGTAFVGASPERLVRTRGTAFQTAAIAGTAPRGNGSDDDDRLGNALLQSEKDLREHAWVTDAIRAALQPVCETLEIPSRPELMRLPGLQHLASPIRGTLQEGVEPLDIVAELHPTPAVCGVPREAAMRLIRELEPFSRGLYAGVVGWLEPDGIETAVAIRSMLAREDHTIAFAGAGIVAGSDPTLEDEETRTKLRSFLRAGKWT